MKIVQQMNPLAFLPKKEKATEVPSEVAEATEDGDESVAEV